MTGYKTCFKQISPSFRFYLQLVFWFVGCGVFFKETINRAQQFVSLFFFFLKCELSQLPTTYLSLCWDLFLMRFLLYVCLGASETRCQETNCLRMKGFTKSLL